MADVVDLNARREPVRYTIHVIHDWEGNVTVDVEGIADDPRSRKEARKVLEKVAMLARLLEERDQCLN